jgi:large subunit ribosomal protein L21
MFAVIKTGGKQYKVAAKDVITVEKLAGEAGETVAFEDVLMLVADSGTQFGAPTVPGVTVAGEVVEQTRGPKTISFKKRRRKNSKRKKGHRQDLTVVRITEILTGGAKPALKARATASTAPAPAAAKPAKAEAAAPVAAAALPAGERDHSNLSLISGIGPTIEKKLRAAGITSWDQIAAWTDADLERLDKELALRNRHVREEWVQQAKELIAGKPPRAKVDKAELASGKDL